MSHIAFAAWCAHLLWSTIWAAHEIQRCVYKLNVKPTSAKGSLDVQEFALCQVEKQTSEQPHADLRASPG